MSKHEMENLNFGYATSFLFIFRNNHQSRPYIANIETVADEMHYQKFYKSVKRPLL